MSIDGLVSEGEFLDITEIKRQQAEDYECITNNGVAPPDQRKVKVTVNCKYLCITQLPSGDNSASHAIAPRCINNVCKLQWRHYYV